MTANISSHIEWRRHRRIARVSLPLTPHWLLCIRYLWHWHGLLEAWVYPRYSAIEKAKAFSTVEWKGEFTLLSNPPRLSASPTLNVCVYACALNLVAHDGTFHYFFGTKTYLTRFHWIVCIRPRCSLVYSKSYFVGQISRRHNGFAQNGGCFPYLRGWIIS